MKIKFEDNLDYQMEAIRSVVEVFNGQEKLVSNFSVLAPTKTKNNQLTTADHETGYGNRLNLNDKQILKNVVEIQLRNGMPISTPEGIDLKDLQFSIDMETGTGKTYVFTRSIFEMHRKYGMKKFIIVVPSVSIREGIYKSLQLTNEHFKKMFDNVPYKFFIYDSNNLSEVRDFATSNQIRIMIINIQAFARNTKAANLKKIKEEDIFDKTVGRILLDYNDKLGATPINLIRETNPVVIVDEPQTTMSSVLQKESIKRLNPLAIFRFSATHKEKVNTLFKYNAVDAYNDGKVKKIEVAAVTTDSHVSDGAYVYLHSVSNHGGFSAKVTVDVKGRNGMVKRQTKTVKVGRDLYELTKLDQYFGYTIRDMGLEPEFIEFQNNQFITAGQVIGGMDDSELKRKLISKTIMEHLEKERVLNAHGIKVLSLFFIDEVAKYREYDEDGNHGPGLYAQMFEEEYQKIISSPKIQNLFKDQEILDLNEKVENVHAGYFSRDKKKKVSDKKESYEYFKDTSGSTKADEDTYQLIMKDKERLLSFDNKVRFIFSHSALKEGWDNPNVFQICFLKEQGSSEIRRRQEVGRGLRIAVNQNGERDYSENVNILTTVVNESFEAFVKGYQKELQEETGIKFGYLEPHDFNNVVISVTEGLKGETIPEYLGQNKSEELFKHFVEQGYLDKKGKVQDHLRRHLREEKVNLGVELAEAAKNQILAILKKVAGRLDIKNQEKRDSVPLNKEVYLSDDFKNLWNSIKYHTHYSFEFDSNKLIKECIKSIDENVINRSVQYLFKKGTLDIDESGINPNESSWHEYAELSTYRTNTIPDIITYLQNETDLTRKTIVQILKGVNKSKIKYLKSNPQAFIEQCIQIINYQKEMLIIDGIKYSKIGESHFYKQDRIVNDKLMAYLENEMIVEATKSPYKKIICDSNTEKSFAKELEDSPAVTLYAKLPSWFTIPTPLGNYNPDWAIVYEINGDKKLYFITETKSTLFDKGLRPTEAAKIKCGKKHFESIDSKLYTATSLKDVMDQL